MALVQMRLWHVAKRQDAGFFGAATELGHRWRSRLWGGPGRVRCGGGAEIRGRRRCQPAIGHNNAIAERADG